MLFAIAGLQLLDATIVLCNRRRRGGQHTMGARAQQRSFRSLTAVLARWMDIRAFSTRTLRQSGFCATSGAGNISGRHHAPSAPPKSVFSPHRQAQQGFCDTFYAAVMKPSNLELHREVDLGWETRDRDDAGRPWDASLTSNACRRPRWNLR